MRKYVGSTFLKPDDLREGTLAVTIAAVEEGRYDKPNLTFDNGSKLSVNKTNSARLAKAYGYESADWIGQRVNLSLGETNYAGEPQETILITPIKRTSKSGMDDDIPFS